MRVWRPLALVTLVVLGGCGEDAASGTAPAGAAAGDLVRGESEGAVGPSDGTESAVGAPRPPGRAGSALAAPATEPDLAGDPGSRAVAAGDPPGGALGGGARWPLAIDTHCDTTQRMLDRGDDITTRLPNGHLDVPRMREGGLSAAFLSVWVDPRRYAGEEAWARAQALLSAIEAMIAAHPGEVVLARTAREVREAHAAGRIAFLVGIEGAHALGEAEPAVLFARLTELHARGARYVTLTWTNDNVFAHASTGAHPERGLTELGRELVTRMNALGIVVDVSHVSDATAREAVELSSLPVLASHSAARALGEHPRNVPDDLIRAIAERGGAVCVNYYAQFVDPAYGAARREVERAHRAEIDAIEGRSWETNTERNALVHRLAPELMAPPLALLVDHVAHVVEVGGPGAACLGSDYDGTSELAGMEDVTDLPAFFAAMELRGLPLAPILGENVLRVLSASAGE